VMTQVDQGLTRGSTRLTWSLAQIMLIKTGASQPTPLKRISSRDSKVKDERRVVFSNRDITHEIKLVLLQLDCRFLAEIAFIYPGVLILSLGLILLRVRARICIMPGLSTIVAKAGRGFLRL
jgi:hypothetical protein